MITAGSHASANNGEQLTLPPSTPARSDAAVVCFGTSVVPLTPGAPLYSSVNVNVNNTNSNVLSFYPSHAAGVAGAVPTHANPSPNLLGSPVALGNAAPATIISPVPVPVPFFPIYNSSTPTYSFGTHTAAANRNSLARPFPVQGASQSHDSASTRMQGVEVRKDKSYLTTETLNMLLIIRNKKDTEVVVGANGNEARFRKARQYGPCPASPTGALYDDPTHGQVAVVVRDDPESIRVVADAMVAYAIKRGLKNFAAAFDRNMPVLRTAFLRRFWGSPLEYWLEEASFKSAVESAFSDPAEAKNRDDENQLRMQNYLESQNARNTATGVSHGPLCCCLVPLGCLDLFWIRVAPSHIVRY
jgi:hypothetical protein